MHASALVFFAHVVLASFTGPPSEKRAISDTVYNDLVFYFKYASSAYSDSCPNPNGNVLVTEFSNSTTDTHGFVARDDTRKEIVVSLRGSSSFQNFVTDAKIKLIELKSPGISPPPGTQVHSGFLEAWNSVANSIIAAFRSELVAHPGYALVSTGHSLGGSLSSLAASSLKANFGNSPVTMYTYGQPRTGNPTYAFWLNGLFGPKIFRGVHTFDGVPTIIPMSFGYKHHGVEYWSNPDPSSAENTKQCAADGEDPTCSDSIPSTGVNSAHLVYYGIIANTPFCNT